MGGRGRLGKGLKEGAGLWGSGIWGDMWRGEVRMEGGGMEVAGAHYADYAPTMCELCAHKELVFVWLVRFPVGRLAPPSLPCTVNK